ncbi:MAG TPA: nuclease-related domain-containing protein, partial [Chthonomonas sp.]|uniref:nuclease-related domain-containing protein n=1 Tax=Chthonomonas sp. TaxID=2282153 RepID=UPI002B4AD44D
MAKIIAVGQPVNDAERQAIAYLRDHLPLNYTVIHNVELPGKENMEIDLVVLAPHCVYVVDVKGVRGSVDIYGTKWYPQGRQPYTSPLLKGRQNAKILKALLTDDNPTHPE